MQQIDFAPHWHFALSAAFARLEQLVWEFDTVWLKIERRGHAYVGCPSPTELINIVDGFLNEREKLFQGDIANLEKMKASLGNVVEPIYQSGQSTAHLRWQNTNQKEHAKLAEFDFDQFHDEAKRIAPDGVSASDKSWFFEGFSRSWQQEWMDYQKNLLGS